MRIGENGINNKIMIKKYNNKKYKIEKMNRIIL